MSLVTCFAGHAHHAFLFFPKADVIFEGEKIKQELGGKDKQFRFFFCSLYSHRKAITDVWGVFLDSIIAYVVSNVSSSTIEINSITTKIAAEVSNNAL